MTNQTVDILDTKWERGKKKLKALSMLVLFNQREIKIKIKKNKEIKKMIKFNFFDLESKNKKILKQDFKKELRLNKKECKKTLRINKKAEKIIINSTYLSH